MEGAVTAPTQARQQVVLTGGAGLLKALAASPETLRAKAFRRQCGAIVFRRAAESAALVEVLVITSRDTGRWVIPKGWPMKNRKPHEAAAIEALQEAGVRGKASKKSLGQYTYLKRLDTGVDVPCIVDLYQIEAETLEDEFKEKGQRVLEWVTPSEASRRVQEPELKSILRSFTPRGKKRRA